MWKNLLSCVLASLALVLTSFLPFEAQAKRLGGARTLGAQRNVTTPPAPPARSAGQSEQAGAPAMGAAPAVPGGAAKWAPVLGGLALGGLLGALYAGNGLGALALVLLLAAGVFLLVKVLARGARQPGPLGYAAIGTETVAAPPPSQAVEREILSPAAPGAVPAGFDVPVFLRTAKLNFVKLQLAHERGDLQELREFTTPQMFEHLRADVHARAADQQTDVVTLHADLLEVTTEQATHCASVRFSGLVRERGVAAPSGFQEVWNLVKPADGSSGWLLAGVQQMH